MRVRVEGKIEERVRVRVEVKDEIAVMVMVELMVMPPPRLDAAYLMASVG